MGRRVASLQLWALGSGLWAIFLAAGCTGRDTGAAAAAPSQDVPQFVDVAQSLGVRFRHTSGRSGRFYLAETMGAGCAFLDYDGDGRLDLFFVNSSRLPGFAGKGPFTPALYRQRPDGQFEDVTRPAGLAVETYGMGCAVGDFDNDGDPDLYLAGMGANHLFRNDGGGAGGKPARFTDVTRAAGVGDPRLSTSCAWFDYDRDGDLDLFVCNYCRWSPASNLVCHAAQWRHVCPPNHYPGEPSTLYRNDGDGTFSDVTRAAGVFSDVGKALGVTVWDANDDGWLDFVVACDMEPNLLYRNNRDGTFSEIGVESGCAYSAAGKARAGMGIDTADIQNDGVETILIGNNSREGLALFRPEPGDAGRFVDVAERAGLFRPSFLFLTFGAIFCDVDLDGRKDAVTVNGHINEVVERYETGITYAERMQLYQNAGSGQFVEVGERAGPAFRDAIVGRGLAVGDYDRDGDPDLLVTVNNGPARLLRNDSPPGRHWLQVRLIGTRSNRDGIGSRVRVTAGGMRQTSWVRSGSSYCSANDLKAYFGLGRADRVERLEVRWPTGRVQELRDLAADQMLTVTEPDQ